MSDNTEILIIQKKKKWIATHNDLERGKIDKIGEAKTLEKLLDLIEKWKENYWEWGYYEPEYGMRIIKRSKQK